MKIKECGRQVVGHRHALQQQSLQHHLFLANAQKGTRCRFDSLVPFVNLGVQGSEQAIQYDEEISIDNVSIAHAPHLDCKDRN